jgi:hypothetical protein
MDRYERFLAEVIKETKAAKITWDAVSPVQYSDYIFNAPFAYQAYEAKYSVGTKDYTLVFVEKKSPSTENDFDIVMERYRCELIIISDGKLVFTLSKDYVDYDELLKLASLIERKNSNAEELFSHFDGE